MSDRTKIGLGVIEAALLLGLLGDALLRATPWGLNVFLWTAAFVAAAQALSRQRGARSAGEARWLWWAVAALAACFAWRDSLTLKLLDTLTIFAALSLLALGARGGRVLRGGTLEYLLAACVAAANSLFGVFPLVFSDVKWKEIPRRGWSRHALAVARGLLIAVPLLLLFGALFTAADALYEGIMRDTFALDGEVVFTHVLLFAFFAWVTGGFLRGMLLAQKPITGFSGLSAYTTTDFSKPPYSSPYSAKAAPAQGATAGGEAREGAGPAADAPADFEGRQANVGAYRDGAGDAPHARGGYRFSASQDEGADAPRDESAHYDSDRAEPADAAGGTRQDAATAGAVAASNTGEAASQAAAPQPEASQAASSSRPSLGIVEVGVVIGLLDLLFLSFVLVQLRYFFGDAQHVVTSAGLTFSDYARRGFFELVWVAVLAIPLLLAAHWLLRKENPAHERAFRVLAGAMTAMLFVIMGSALWRMRLYQEAYGQTELRFYTTAFMLWLGAVLVWFVLTVLRGRRERFAFGAVAAWLVALAVLHLVNPGDLIARSNLLHARDAGRPERFDAAYVVTLGADSVPALVGALPEMRQRERHRVAAWLADWLDRERRTDWRSWNLARARARRLVERDEAALRDWAARWQNELAAERELAAREAAARQAASRDASRPAPQVNVAAAAAYVPGTPFSVSVERREGATAGTVPRTATLAVGVTAVSALSLPADDGSRTRVEMFRLSDGTILLRDAYGAYDVDLERRTLARRPQEAGEPSLAGATLIGAFDLDAARTWRFTPAPTKTATPPRKEKR